MKPDNLTVFQLFERQQRYVVPLFQRPYVWDQEKQWEPLWETIADKAVAISEEKNPYEKVNRHFLGAVVLNSMRQRGFQVPVKSIVDGQQRLTTLQIILVVLRDYANSIGYDDLVQNFDLLTENRVGKIKNFERYKVWPTQADQQAFEVIYTAGSPDAVKLKYPLYFKAHARKPEPRPRLVDAYLYFYEALGAYLYDEDDAGNEDDKGENNKNITAKLDYLEDAFLRYMEIVTIDLDEKDNPQVIFESLNYRGEPLLPSDLIRNFVFLEATKERKDVESLYQNYWYEYDKPENKGGVGFWKQDEKQGRIKRPRLDLFVFHYLTYLRGRELPITRLYKEFQTWWFSDEKRSVEVELQKMLEFSRVFSTFYNPDKNSRLGIYLYRLRELDVSTVYPLMLLLLAERGDTLNKAVLTGIVNDIESYLVRRQVCGLTTKNYNKIFLSLFNNLRKETEITREKLQQLLLDLKGASARWPKDDEFKENWLNEPVYRSLRRKTAMILEAIDMQLTTAKQEKILIEDRLTIEHVLPQKWKEATYPLPIVPKLSKDEIIERRENLLHSFGNLTLLTKSLNSALRDGPFVNKRPEIAKQSALRMNTYFQTMDNPNRWNEDNILQRGEALFGIALKIWPYPEKS